MPKIVKMLVYRNQLKLVFKFDFLCVSILFVKWSQMECDDESQVTMVIAEVWMEMSIFSHLAVINWSFAVNEGGGSQSFEASSHLQVLGIFWVL